MEHLDVELGGPLPLEEAFSLERIGQRYSGMDAQMDRLLLAASAIGGGSSGSGSDGSSGAATPAAAAASVQSEAEGMPAAAEGGVEGDAGMPSPGRSVSTLGEEGSASLAAPSTARSLAGGGDGEEEEEGNEARGEVEAVSKAVGELRVAA